VLEARLWRPVGRTAKATRCIVGQVSQAGCALRIPCFHHASRAFGHTAIFIDVHMAGGLALR